jgi:hypothetical protein
MKGGNRAGGGGVAPTWKGQMARGKKCARLLLLLPGLQFVFEKNTSYAGCVFLKAFFLRSTQRHDRKPAIERGEERGERKKFSTALFRFIIFQLKYGCSARSGIKAAMH